MSDDANKLAIEAICMHICTGSYKQLSHTAEFNYWMVPDSNNRLVGCGDRLLRYSDYSAAPTTPVPLRLRVPVRLHQAVQAVRLLFRLSGYFKIVRLHRRLHQLRPSARGFGYSTMASGCLTIAFRVLGDTFRMLDEPISWLIYFTNIGYYDAPITTWPRTKLSHVSFFYIFWILFVCHCGHIIFP